MKRYIAYFDYLGYKEFILKNETEQVKHRVGHLLRDIETSLSDKLTVSEKTNNLIADLQDASVHCLNISDTVIFYTKDDSLNSFEDILKVSYEFNCRNNLYNFPVRGILVCDEFEMISDVYRNENGVSYRPNIIYGKGLVLAHLKCDNQEWAGCCIDESVINKAIGTEKEGLLNEKAIKYDIPIKSREYGIYSNYALRLYINGANEAALENLNKDIDRVFGSDNKSVQNDSVQRKIANTKQFIDFLKDK